MNLKHVYRFNAMQGQYLKRHVLIGGAAALLLLLIYIGIITWAQGFIHALE